MKRNRSVIRFNMREATLRAVRAWSSSARVTITALGRWTQQDPAASSLGNPDSLNRYVYVGDDPVNQVDPSGTFSLPCWLSVPINVFEVVTAAALIYSATLFGLPAAVVAFLSGPITAGTGIAIGLAISFLYAFVVIAGVTTIIQGLEAIRACL